MNDDAGKEIAKEIAKELYEDAGKAVAKPTGDLVGLIPRAIKAALSPVEKWILQREYNIAETRKLLEQKLEAIPAELIEEPEPYIALPAIQSLSYSMDNDELREMYANLLANSMISTVKNGVHPGFVEVIKQLTPDEAKVLRYLFNKKAYAPTITLRWENDNGEGVDVLKDFSNVGELAECESPYSVNLYINNLVRLGLLFHSGSYQKLTNDEIYAPIKEHEYLKQFTTIPDEMKDHGYTTVQKKEGYAGLSDFGLSFCSICLGVNKIVNQIHE